jgi:hypothetical protein
MVGERGAACSFFFFGFLCEQPRRQSRSAMTAQTDEAAKTKK